MPPIAPAIASARLGSSKTFPTTFIPSWVARSRRRRATKDLLAEHFSTDRGEQSLGLGLLGDLLLGEDPAPLVFLGPRRLQHVRRVARRQQDFPRLRVARQSLHGHVQQAFLVEDEVHLLPGGLRREAQRAQVLVVDDALAVTLEDVQLEPAGPARRQSEAALRGNLRVLLDHLAEAPARPREAARHR